MAPRNQGLIPRHAAPGRLDIAAKPRHTPAIRWHKRSAMTRFAETPNPRRRCWRRALTFALGLARRVQQIPPSESTNAPPPARATWYPTHAQLVHNPLRPHTLLKLPRPCPDQLNYIGTAMEESRLRHIYHPTRAGICKQNLALSYPPQRRGGNERYYWE